MLWQADLLQRMAPTKRADANASDGFREIDAFNIIAVGKCIITDGCDTGLDDDGFNFP